MRRILLAATASLLPLVAHAQAIPLITPKVTLAGPTGLNAAMSTKADTQNGTLTSPSISGGKADGITIGGTTPAPGAFSSLTIPAGGSVSADFSAANISQIASLGLMTLVSLIENQGIVPDAYVQTGDAGDIGLAIIRASTAACTLGTALRFMGKVYQLKSSVQPQCEGQHWIGQKPSITKEAYGTWLALSNTAASAIQVGQSGFVLEDVAFDQVQPAPSGSPAVAWTPTNYPAVLTLNAPDILLRNVFLDGVFSGISASGAGRLHVHGLKAQCFQSCAVIDNSLDDDDYEDIHVWPFWSANSNVLAYQETNLNTWLLERVDTAHMDAFFTYSANSGVTLGVGGNGSTTKFSAGSIACDGTRYCLVDSGMANTAHIASLNTQGQQFSSYLAPYTTQTAKALAGATALLVNGQGILQIGHIQAQFVQNGLMTLLNTTSCSNVMVDDAFVDFTYAITNPYFVNAAQCDGTTAFNTISFGMVPQAQGQSGTVVAQSATLGATVYWPNPVSH